MKRLVYFCINEKYIELFLRNYTVLRRLNQNKIDILCITDTIDCADKVKQKCKDVYTLTPETINIRYDGLFRIAEWDKAEDYTSFLYLDADNFAIKPLDKIFELIENDENVIHGAPEAISMRDPLMSNEMVDRCAWRYHHNDLLDDPPYNSGIFGFSQKMLKWFPELVVYANENKDRNTIVADQQPFNHFTIENNIIHPTFAGIVCFKRLKSDRYGEYERVKLEDSWFVHFIEPYSQPETKLIRAKVELKDVICSPDEILDFITEDIIHLKKTLQDLNRSLNSIEKEKLFAIIKDASTL